jgi:dihydrofolate synthase/folylpolyglutamate synthase
MFSRIGAAAFKKDLTNTIRLCEFLGDPHKKFKSIHVAGTNGKGSVCHMLAAIFQTVGYKTGLYTSPHLKDFRERIKINGKEVKEQFVIDFTARIKPLIEEINPSFFEITVAMAFDYFAEQKIDIAIIETGLGGRLDSTNIITPEISVITNIGWDHMNMLGDSLEKIAIEKAGIIKENIPVVIGETIPESMPVFERIAYEKKTELNIAAHKHKVMDWHWERHHLIVEIAEENKTDHWIFELDLPGIYQTKNLVTVLEICSVMKRRGWDLTDQAIEKGLKRTKYLTGLHGRWEIIHQSPTVVLDVAHNIDGIEQLLQQIEVTAHKELHIIFGMVNDKETDKILELFPKTANYYFTKAMIPRALDEGELSRSATAVGLSGRAFTNVNLALQHALQHANKDDLIIICGSVFLVGEVKRSTRSYRSKWPY